MYEFSIFQLFLMFLLFAILGLIIGYISRKGEVSKEQEDRIEQLETELEALQEHSQNVSDHFHESAALLNDMTRQYKKIYEHMAKGANELCDEKASADVLERLETGLLVKENLIDTDKDATGEQNRI